MSSVSPASAYPAGVMGRATRVDAGMAFGFRLSAFAAAESREPRAQSLPQSSLSSIEPEIPRQKRLAEHSRGERTDGEEGAERECCLHAAAAGCDQADADDRTGERREHQRQQHQL